MMADKTLATPDPFDAFELAGLIYEDGVSVDHLMSVFAAELQQERRRIGGVVQLPPAEDTEPGQVRLMDVMTGETWLLKQRLGPGAGGCTLDSAALAAGSLGIRRAIEARVDLVFISKFSKQEIDGRGFRAEFGAAVQAGLPVITSIKRPVVTDWLHFTGGLGTLLQCRLRVLRDWWVETDRRRQAELVRRGRSAAARSAKWARPVGVDR